VSVFGNEYSSLFSFQRNILIHNDKRDRNHEQLERQRQQKPHYWKVIVLVSNRKIATPMANCALQQWFLTVLCLCRRLAAEGVLFTGCPCDRASVCYRILKLCEHYILQTAGGNSANLQLRWRSWRQR